MRATALLLTASALAALSADAATIKSVSALARTEAVARLGTEFGRLVDSLDDFMHDTGFSPVLWPQAARSRLAQEADFMDSTGDALGALLFRDFARQMPFADLFSPRHRTRHLGSLSNFTAGVSETVEVRTDGKGRLVKRVVRCENGVCTNTTEAVDPAELQLPRTNATGVQQAVQSLTDNLKQLFDGMGFGKLQGVFRDVFNSPFAEAMAGEKDLPAAAPQLPPAFGDHPGGTWDKIFSDMFGDAANVSKQEVKSSTVTRIKDGKLVQETTRCVDGRCVKETREEDLASGA